jgi:rsbT co-antagonist protein RsbR
MTVRFADLLRERLSEVVSELVQRGRRDVPASAASLSDEEAQRRATVAAEAYIRALAGDPPTAYTDLWRQSSYLRFRAGVPLRQMQVVGIMINAGIWECLKRFLEGDPKQQVEAAEACAAIAQGGVMAIYTAYEQAKDEVIAAQKANIRQLSTPIIPIYRGILVLPLVGAIDASRAADILERLLHSITRARASVVIIDITGVEVVDTEVAHHLLRASRASELLGAKVIFVGLSPATAQALVHLGVDLSGLTTLANLEAGLEHALRAQGLAIGLRGLIR